MRLLLLVACVVFLSGPGARPCQAERISQDELPENHLLFRLQRVEGSFQGANEYLPGFTISMDVSDEVLEEGLTVTSLKEAIRKGEISGVLAYENGSTSKIQYLLVDHRGAEDIYMKTRLGYFLWEQSIVQDDEITFVIDFMYTPPARDVDLKTLQLAEEALADSANWHKNDDRRCEDDVESDRFSLFCALKHFSMETMGEYNHHNTAMNTVRFVIHDLVDHQFAHTLMDYNNAESTRHKDILRVLRMARTRVQEEINERNERP